MKKVGIYFDVVCQAVVKVVIFILLGVITCWTALYTSCYPADYSMELLQVYEDNPVKNMVAVLTGTVLLGIAAWFLFRNKSEKQKSKIVWYFAICETLLTGIFLTVWITITQFPQSRDAQQVYTTAQAFLRGDFEYMKSSYIQGFQQQLNLVFLEEIVLRIWEDYRVFQYLNVLCIVAIIFFLYRITDKIFHNQIVNLFCLVSVAGFIPMHLYSNLVYGDICSTALGIVSVWALISWCDTKKKRFVAVAALSLSIATLARKNTLIILIAVLICLTVYALKEWDWRSVVAGLVIIICVFGCLQMVSFTYEKRSGIELGDSMPTVLWIAMGMQGDYGGHGVYNGYHESIFYHSGNNAEEASRLGWEKVEEMLDIYRNNPEQGKEFYRYKMIEQWGEPTLGSMILTYNDRYEKQDFVEAVYKGSVGAKLMSYQNYYTFAVYFSVLLYVIFSIRNKNSIWQLSLLFVVAGGIMFSIIWENKSRYVFPYVICMIPYMAWGIWAFQDKAVKLVRIIVGNVHSILRKK